MKNKLYKYVSPGLIIAGTFTIGIGALAITQNHLNTARPSDIATTEPQPCQRVAGSEPMMRTELFFGLRKPNGAVVNNTEFQQFLDREVTPRFPDGFTLLTGQGQFKNAQGVILSERSKLLILLYPVATTSSQQIEQIRKVYVSTFQQQSVLRTDELSCTSF